MKTLRFVALATVATFCLPAQESGKPKSGVPAEAAAKGAPAAPLIGVVDLVKAIQQYPKYVTGNVDLDNKRKAATADLDELKKTIDEKRAAASMVPQDSEEWRERQDQIELLQMQGKALLERYNRRIEIEEMRHLFAIYQDLEVAIEKVAKARGVSIVLRTHAMEDPKVDLAKMTPKSLKGRLNMFDMRQVWYANDQVDLTEDLVKLLMVPLEDAKDGAKDAAGPAKDAARPSPEKAETPKKTGG